MRVFRSSRVGVGGHQVARRPVVAVRGDAVSGEIEEHSIIGRDEPAIVSPSSVRSASPRAFSKRRVHDEVLLFGQHLRQPAGIVDGGLQGRHLLVGVDADDEGVVPREGQRLRGRRATGCRPS